MGLMAVTQAVELIRQGNVTLTEMDKEFVVQFAFRTNDRALTNKLIDELAQPRVDREDVCRKYQTLVGFVPDWLQKVENLLVSLEMYRLQEEAAIKTLSEFLSACGISMSEDEIRNTDIAKMQERVKKVASL